MAPEIAIKRSPSSQLTGAGEDGGDAFRAGMTPLAQVGGNRPGVVRHSAMRDGQMITVVLHQKPVRDAMAARQPRAAGIKRPDAADNAVGGAMGVAADDDIGAAAGRAALRRRLERSPGRRLTPATRGRPARRPRPGAATAAGRGGRPGHRAGRPGPARHGSSRCGRPSPRTVPPGRRYRPRRRQSWAARAARLSGRTGRCSRAASQCPAAPAAVQAPQRAAARTGHQNAIKPGGKMPGRSMMSR